MPAGSRGAPLGAGPDVLDGPPDGLRVGADIKHRHVPERPGEPEVPRTRGRDHDRRVPVALRPP
jgi:hypothetical protein